MVNSSVAAAEALPNSAVAGVVGGELAALAAGIVHRWVREWGKDPECRNFLRRRRFLEELEEALVACHLVIEHLRLHPTGDLCMDSGPSAPLSTAALPLGSGSKKVVYDLCCGKGFFSLLLSFLLPLVPDLGTQVSEIVMADKNSAVHNSIGLGHIRAAQAAEGCVPLRFVKANLHDKQLPVTLGMTPDMRAVLVGIHLCERLSSRCVHLYQAMAEVDCLILSPCCVPMHGGPIILQAAQINPAELISSADPYDRWVEFLHTALKPGEAAAGHVWMCMAPLMGGPKRRRAFLVASRGPTERQLLLAAARAHRSSQPPDPACECSEYWYQGNCRWGPACKFSHRRGHYMQGAHI